jgi:hypothetical protein
MGEGADPAAAANVDSSTATAHQTCCDQRDHQRAATPNARTTALAAGALGLSGPVVNPYTANPYRCLWMMGAAPRYAGVDRRSDDLSSDLYSAQSDFVDAEGGIYCPKVYKSTDELSEHHAAVKNERRVSRVWRRQQQAARVEAITAVARRLLRAAPDAVPALTLYPTTVPSTILRAAMATQPTAMRALRLELFHMSQGLAVTLLRRACLAWAESLREVRVDVSRARDWQFEMSRSVYVALAGCPHLEVVSVPDIFLHYHEDHYDCTDASPRRATTEGPRGPAPPYFRTLRHLDLHDGPHTDASWRVICGKLPALHTLVLRFLRRAPRFIASLASAPLYEHLSLERLASPTASSWCAGFSALLKCVRIRRLYLDNYGVTRDIHEALNTLAAYKVRARRDRSGSGSDSRRDTDRDDESDRSADGACNATFDAVLRNHAADPDWVARPRFVRTRSRRRAAEKDLIPLEVFSIYGWRDEGKKSQVTPFMRYLARSAPHLREVALVNANARGVLALRHAISTSLTGLDLRYGGLGDIELATLLRSRTGRRLRSLMVAGEHIFHDVSHYAVLMRPGANAPYIASLLSDGSDGDANNNPVHGSSGAPLPPSPAEYSHRWVDDPEPRLPRLRRLDVRCREGTDVEAIFNGPRLVWTSYAVVPPL